MVINEMANEGEQSEKTGPTAVDRGFQLAYVCAYRLMRAYWTLRHPMTHGALVTLWHGGEVLLVRNSYVPYYSAPGGYIHSGEKAADAALRELREEVGVVAERDRLVPLVDETHEWEGKRDHVEIFALEVAERPHVRIDYREVIEARWFTPEDVEHLNVFPPLKRAIDKYRAVSAPRRS